MNPADFGFVVCVGAAVAIVLRMGWLWMRELQGRRIERLIRHPHAQRLNLTGRCPEHGRVRVAFRGAWGAYPACPDCGVTLERGSLRTPRRAR